MFVFYVLYLHKNNNMPRYHKLGKMPHKRHTTFRKEDGNIHYEELFGTIGFDGMSSLLYHLHRPTQVKDIKKAYSVAPEIAEEKKEAVESKKDLTETDKK